MNTNGVSVIIPTRNRAQLVREAVESVLQQTHPAVEVIVVDDASTDGTEQTLAAAFPEALRDGRLAYGRQTTQQGRSCARNHGISRARGRYLAFLDDDDLFLPDHLTQVVGALTKSDAVGTGVLLTDWQKRPLARYRIFFRGRLPPRELALLGFGLTNSNAAIRREVLDRVGGFRAGMEQGEDIDFWMRVAMSGSVRLVRKTTVLRRVHQQHYTADQEEAHQIRFGDGLKDMLLANSRELGFEPSPRLLAYLHLFLARNGVRRGERDYARERLRLAVRHWPWLPILEPGVWNVMGRATLLRHPPLQHLARKTQQLCRRLASAS